MARKPTRRPTMALVRRLLAALRDAHDTMRDVAQRLDVTTVGQAQWDLMRGADRALTAIRSAEQD